MQPVADHVPRLCSVELLTDTLYTDLKFYRREALKNV